MTNKEMIAQMLGDYGAMTSRQIAVQIFNKLGVSLTPAQVAGTLRSMMIKNEVANSKDERNQSRYWLVNDK
jgi:hypothetical protein